MSPRCHVCGDEVGPLVHRIQKGLLRPLDWDENGELILTFEPVTFKEGQTFLWLCEEHAHNFGVATQDLTMTGCALCCDYEPREFIPEGEIDEEEVILVQVGIMVRGDKKRVPTFEPHHGGLLCYDCMSTKWDFPTNWESV